MQLRLILEAVRSSPEFYILVSYIDMAPENIRFAEKDFGKPVYQARMAKSWTLNSIYPIRAIK